MRSHTTSSRALAVMLGASILTISLPTRSPLATTRSHDAVAGIGHSAALIAENSLPGTLSWRISTPSTHHEIEGYASATSVNRGGTIDFFVNTVAPSYSIEIYRMGWYQGLGARLMEAISPLPGVRQPACSLDTRRMIACPWSRSYSLFVPASWLSGVYLAKLTANPEASATGGSAQNWQSYIIFVVRDDALPSAILFQTSVTTYQAYNLWGGTSLYTGLVEGTNQYQYGARAYAVSFDRPYERGNGAGDFFFFEYPMLRWLEMKGYDVTYDTDLDTDASGALLLDHKAFLSVGHDEYWSRGMRDNVENALRHGVSLGFFGANAAYWQVRLEPSFNGPRRVVVCYKSAQLDPYYHVRDDLVTVEWRDPLVNRPEDSLIGQMYGDWFRPPYFALKPLNTQAWPFAGTKLSDGDSIPGIVGYEFDHVFHDATTPKNVMILASSPVVTVNGRDDVANVTLYTAPSGARVFAAGTIQWSWGLEDDTLDVSVDDWSRSRWPIGPNTWARHQVASDAIRQFTANIIDNFVRYHGINRVQNHSGPIPE
ncbi:MAG TPA: N,N-dimethylformamidase beta subunit family domain-containing protein [Chloroflexota bacterium]|nr:N,N-dimethylformamidase beta subunit family domain-containing protein [Chloroflexota bacterium]